ncbi:MAG: hypothetical protein ACM3PY_12520 [Omnitrophica WOR_2 bacterium]
MNKIRKVPKVFFIALLVAMLSLVLVVPPAAAAPSTGWLSMWGPTVSGCSFTVKAEWAGVNGAKTLELWLTQNPTYDGQHDTAIPPTHLEPVNGKSGTFTYTFPSLAASTTVNYFRGWGQLLDSHGNPISGTLDFTGYGSAYCTAP